LLKLIVVLDNSSSKKLQLMLALVYYMLVLAVSLYWL